MALNDVLDELQLPVSTQEQEAGLERLRGWINQSRIYKSLDSYLLALSEDVEQFTQTGQVGKAIRIAVSAVLENTTADSIGLDGDSFFRLVEHLQRGGKRDWRGLSPQESLRLLSRATFIYGLLKRERLSTSQISRLLVSLESSLDVPYKAIQVLSSHFGLTPSLTVDEFETDILPKDVENANAHLTDTSADESCEIAGGLAAPWTDGRSLTEDLRLLITQGEETVLTAENATEWPYLQMLHWCMLPLEKYDHPASYLYEFGPRGALGATVFDLYGVATGNAVLNNAKAVSQLDDQWARNRSGASAHALVRILHRVESLPFRARRSVAAIIRAWLVRIIELTDKNLTLLNRKITDLQVEGLCTFIENGESNTQGVIEQRIVDALSVLAFHHDNWVPRGLGDSVNASNLSRHKLGDVEFANIDERTAVALEAHGGVVTPTYVKGHQQSLARIIEQRLDESWANLDEPKNWRIQVIFVSHGSSGELPNREIMYEVPVRYEYWDYSQLVSRARKMSSNADFLNAFKKYYIDALNREVVPQRIRNKAAQLINVAEVQNKARG
ncbi:hypothetical protein QEV13_07930 [Trueperella pyogenes]|uniref:hypothetical protein n=1 Tax=Trueperella pyogenes TaxID=1661 RepID=UPI0024C04729|nr:hypothetical protein [Trueperella pyogenes]WHU60568.1 hypothetical protein QEV13_07930 [Trueperella pyogenes]